MIKESVDAAITVERARHANAGNNASGYGQARGQVTAHVVRECTFAGFMKCNPDNFRSTKGAVELRRWFEKTEMTFGIRECAEDKKVKFAAATLRGPGLTWWNSKVAILGLDIANQMGWTEMKKLMTVEFCPVQELQRMKNELWNLKVKEYNMVAYTQRFNELALMCLRMVELESVNVGAYVRGLSDNIKGEVTSSRPSNLNEVVRMTHKLMEQKAEARNERIIKGNKRKWENFQSGNSSAKQEKKEGKDLDFFVGFYCVMIGMSFDGAISPPDERDMADLQKLVSSGTSLGKGVKLQEVVLFYNRLDVPTRQILNLRGAIPSKTAADAKVAIQEMAEYSQKWHNGTSRTRSIENSD
ncbi:putative reverse transcriptase domain-containing protein [Tanacetum coccineum]